MRLAVVSMMGASPVTTTCLRDSGDRHREIDRQLLTDAKHDPFARLALKAGQRRADGVGARQQRRHDEVPLRAAHRFRG